MIIDIPDDPTGIIPIIFSSGAYGHFVRWCIMYFSGQVQGVPFLNDGSSHRSGVEVGLREHATNLRLFHPKGPGDNTQGQVLHQRLDAFVDTYSKGILLYGNYNRFLLIMNNKIEKIVPSLQSWINDLVQQMPEMAGNLKEWQVENLSQMSPWQIREFLSYFIWTQHASECEIDTIVDYHDPRLIKIDVDQLINHFQPTVEQLLDFCGLTKTRDNFEEIYQAWYRLQKHINKDQLVDSIINSVINNVELTWADKNLSLIDEAVIQMKLRDQHQLDLQCYGLDQFPSNTGDLKKLLIELETE